MKRIFIWIGAALCAAPIQAQISVPCADEVTREHVKAIILEGIDQGLRNHTARQFDSWMKDQTAQPKRALTGMDIAVEAYIKSRGNAEMWEPPLCMEK